jgi:hypothetical protein
MRFFNAVTKGAVKSAKSYNMVLVAWLITLFIIFPAAIILKTGFNSCFGKSMLADSLLAGFDISVLGDLGNRVAPLILQLTRSSLFIILAGTLLSVFFSGGFFARFTTGFGEFKVSDFFRASARFFFPFLGVTVIVLLMIALWGLIVIGAPVLFSNDAARGGRIMNIIMRIVEIIWLLGLPVLLLVADSARTWIAVTGTRKVFRAIGTGFQLTFKSFFKSYMSVFIVMIISILITSLAIVILKNSIPEKGMLIFLLFIETQVIAILKTWIRSWRYATVTELATIKG